MIPPTWTAAKQALGNLEGLVTAKEWERAAIVWAFTEPGRGGPRTSRQSVKLSVKEFSEQGISGLRSQDTVRFYRSQWDRAMRDAGARAAEPGKTLTLPLDLDWQDHGDEQRKKRYVEKDEAAICRSIDRQDLDAEVLAQNLSDEAARTVAARLIEDRPDIARDLVDDPTTDMALIKARIEKEAEEREEHERNEFESSGGIADVHDYVRATVLVGTARHKLNQALKILHSLPPLPELQRNDLRQEIRWLESSVEWLKEVAKARRAASLGEEVEEFLSNQ